MTAVLVTAGIVLAGMALRDVLHELFHPGGSGNIAGWVMRATWRVFRWIGTRRRSVLPLAGPVALVAVLMTWASMVAIGWALVYWPFLPSEFRFASPLVPAAQDGFDDALYASLTALTTLGFGDITPTKAWLRVAATLEGLVGFALLTAGISWILMLYPVLTRRRAFANRVLVLHDAGERSGTGLAEREPLEAARLLDDLTAQLIVVRIDLMLSPISYYFHDNDASVALPRALPHLLGTVEVVGQSESPSVRHAAATLDCALAELATLIGTAHLGMARASTTDVLDAYEREHPHQQHPG